MNWRVYTNSTDEPTGKPAAERLEKILANIGAQGGTSALTELLAAWQLGLLFWY